MSLMNVWIFPHRAKALVAVDTEYGSRVGEGAYTYREGSKMVALPHSNVIIAGRGINSFLGAVISLQIQMAGTFDEIEASMPTHLKGAMDIMEANKAAFASMGSIYAQEIAVVGFSQSRGRMHCKTYLSADEQGFTANDIDEAHYSPWHPSWGEPIRVDTVEHAKFMSTVQSDNANIMQPDEPCGGRLLLAELTRDECRISTAATLTDRPLLTRSTGGKP